MLIRTIDIPGYACVAACGGQDTIWVRLQGYATQADFHSYGKRDREERVKGSDYNGQYLSPEPKI